MYKSDKLKIKLNIELEAGIYKLTSFSGDGKSFLGDVLKDYNMIGEPVMSYNYEDKLHGVPIEIVLTPNKYKVIMLDRYDMYNGDGAKLIEECVNTSVILIDCKSSINIDMDYEYCSLSISKNKIEVW